MPHPPPQIIFRVTCTRVQEGPAQQFSLFFHCTYTAEVPINGELKQSSSRVIVTQRSWNGSGARRCGKYIRGVREFYEQSVHNSDRDRVKVFGALRFHPDKGARSAPSGTRLVNYVPIVVGDAAGENHRGNRRIAKVTFAKRPLRPLLLLLLTDRRGLGKARFFFSYRHSTKTRVIRVNKLK